MLPTRFEARRQYLELHTTLPVGDHITAQLQRLARHNVLHSSHAITPFATAPSPTGGSRHMSEGVLR
jgi:hypothetical protein